MLTLTEGQRAFLLEATEREPVVRVDIHDLYTGELVLSIQTELIDSPEQWWDSEQLGIVGGSVRVDTGAETLRTLSLQLVDPLHELSIGVGNIIGLDKLFTVYKGYKIPPPWGTGEVALWPLGVFVLNGRPEIDAQGGVRLITLQCGDKSTLANANPRGGFRTGFVLSQGLTKRAAILAIAQSETWGETQFNLTNDSTATLAYDRSFDTGSSCWEAVQRLNEIVEPDDRITRLRYDPYGRLAMSMDPGPDLERLPAVWSAQPVDEGFSQLVGATLGADILEGFGNGSRVRWGGNNITPGVVTVYDDEPNSPTYVGRIGWIIRDWKNGQQDDLIQNEAEGLARARFEYQQMRAYKNRVSLTLVEQPALEEWDVIYVNEGQCDATGNYQLLSFTIDLGNSGVMQAEGWQVIRVA